MLLLLPPLFPEQASANAYEVDNLYFYLVGVCGAAALAIVFCIFFFAIRYRRRTDNQLAIAWEVPGWLEIAWMVIPFIFFMSVFFWGAKIYFQDAKAPAGAIEIQCVGRQWMWKFWHPDGQREINQLHIPLNRPIKVRMISEDVIHSFFVPEFRVHMDVLPRRYTTIWFQPTKVGTYHLFCSQYCGTEHAKMIGTVTVMDPAEYEKWLTGGAQGSLALRGQTLFNKLACHACHSGTSQARGPYLTNLYDKPIQLATGEVVTADDNYLRESILKPNARIAAGYQPIMPAYEGQLSEEELIQLITYIKFLGEPNMQYPPVAEPTAPQPLPPATGGDKLPTAAPSVPQSLPSAQAPQKTEPAPAEKKEPAKEPSAKPAPSAPTRPNR